MDLRKRVMFVDIKLRYHSNVQNQRPRRVLDGVVDISHTYTWRFGGRYSKGLGFCSESPPLALIRL